MLTYANPALVKVEPRPGPAPVEGATCLDNNNFDHYRHLVSLDSKRRAMNAQHHREYGGGEGGAQDAPRSNS